MWNCKYNMGHFLDFAWKFDKAWQSGLNHFWKLAINIKNSQYLAPLKIEEKMHKLFYTESLYILLFIQPKKMIIKKTHEAVTLTNMNCVLLDWAHGTHTVQRELVFPSIKSNPTSKSLKKLSVMNFSVCIRMSVREQMFIFWSTTLWLMTLRWFISPSHRILLYTMRCVFQTLCHASQPYQSRDIIVQSCWWSLKSCLMKR